MTYCPVLCELNLLRKTTIPAFKAVFSKRTFIKWILISIPYYILKWVVSSSFSCLLF